MSKLFRRSSEWRQSISVTKHVAERKHTIESQPAYEWNSRNKIITSTLQTYPLQNPNNILREDSHDLLRQRQSYDHDRQKDAPHRHEKSHIRQSQNSHRPVLSLLHHFCKTKEESQQPKDPFEQGGEHDAADDRDVDDVFDGPRWWVDGRSVEEGGRHGGKRMFEGW